MKRFLSWMLYAMFMICCITGVHLSHANAETYTGRVSVPITSYDDFRSTVLNNYYDVDNAYGAQCYDGASLLWVQLGRWLDSGGTGAARGTWEKADARAFNAGTEFSLVYNKENIKRGDVVVLGNNNNKGHIGFADEDYNPGSIYQSMLSQNVNGTPFVVAPIDYSTFLGAFRYNNWNTPIYKELTDPIVFNSSYYRTYPDLEAAFGDDETKLLEHWINNGIAEGRVASPVFDVVYYLAVNPDVDTACGGDHKEAIRHFIAAGVSEGRASHNGFNINTYKANYLNLQQAFGSDNYQYFLHYVNAGRDENRLTTARFKLVFDGNGGTCTTSQKEITKGASYGTLPSKNETVRNGYIFDGWFTEREGGTEVTASTFHLSDDEITTVYAHWTELVLDENWIELSVLPDGLDLTECDVEYNSHYVTTGRTSPGSDWTLSSQGAVQYEAVGSNYESDSELAVSDTRRKVGQYYYHWCGSTMNLANYYQKDCLPTYHSIPMSEAGNYTFGGSIGNDEGHLNSTLYNSDGTLHYCPTGKSAGWYIKFIYQDYQAYQINTYTRDSGWTTQADSDAASVTYRVRRKAVTAIEFETDSIYISRGNSLSPSLTILPETAGRANLTWVSEDPATATVDETGTITALHIGSTVITASDADGSISDTLTVNVVPNTGASSMFVVDGASVGYFTNYPEVESNGVNSGALSEFSREAMACIVREPGDVLGCEAELTFINDCDGYIVTYEVTEGNLVSTGNDTFIVSKNTTRKNVITAHVYDVNDDGAQGAEMATANMVVFVVNNDGTMTLPANLQRLEADALDGTAATIFKLPSDVTLENNGLAGIPTGSIIYFNSDTITPFIDRYVLGVEEYRSPNYFWIDTGSPTMAYFNGDGCSANYYYLCPAE